MGLFRPSALSWDHEKIGDWHFHTFSVRSFKQDWFAMAGRLSNTNVVLFDSVGGKGHRQALAKKDVGAFGILSDARDCQRTTIPASELGKLSGSWEIRFFEAPKDVDESALTAHSDGRLLDCLTINTEFIVGYLEELGSSFLYANEDTCYTFLLSRDLRLATDLLREALLEDYQPQDKDASFPLTESHLSKLLSESSDGYTMSGSDVKEESGEVRFLLWQGRADETGRAVAREGLVHGDDVVLGDLSIRHRPKFVKKEPGIPQKLGVLILQVILFLAFVAVLIAVCR